MRLAAKVDDNQAEIVAGLLKIGASVLYLHALGRGAPDLLVCYRGILYLMEIKDGRKPRSARQLTPAQRRWHAQWPGPVHVVESIEQAMRVIGLVPKCDPKPLGEVRVEIVESSG